VLPGPPLLDHLKLFEAIAIPLYFLIAIVVGCIWSRWLTRRVTHWVDQERPATREEQIATLQLPLRLTLIEVLLWLVAGVIFTAMTVVLQPENALRIAVTILDGMIITCAVSYLLTEFALRPVAARALVDSPPPRRLLAAGLKARTVFFWAVGSGVPVTGLMLAAVLALIEKDVLDPAVGRDSCPGHRGAGQWLAADDVVGAIGGRAGALGADGLEPDRRRAARHQHPGLRRHRARVAAGRVQHDGRGSAGAGADPGSVRPVRRSGRGPGGAHQ
jgi:hypothetical protein